MPTTIDTSIYSSTESYAASRNKSKSLSESVGFDDYLTLMVAELQNQDMYNTADTKEMTQQLAQYSLVTAAEEILEMQNTNYAASLIGKTVTASYSDSLGKLQTNTGVVTGVTLYEGKPLIYVNGVAYNIGEIMVVGTTSPETEDGEGEKEEAVEALPGQTPTEEETEIDSSEIAEVDTVESTETENAEEDSEIAEEAAGTQTTDYVEGDNSAVDEAAIESGLAADTESVSEQ